MEDRQSALDPGTIRAFVQLLEENALAELTIEEEGYSISVKADGALFQSPAPALLPAAAPAERTEEEGEDGTPIRAPMTGVFYRSPAPGEPALVEVGDHVEEGQVIGLIEAMKVFSEVPAEVAGRVVAVRAKNGELVHQDQVLLLMAPEEEGYAG